MIGRRDPLLKAEDVTVFRSGRNILDKVSFELFDNESLAIVGPSGSGKSMLGLVLSQKIFYRGKVIYTDNTNKNIIWVEQQHHFKNLQHTNDLYYQQRFNSYDTEETMTVVQSLGEISEKTDQLFKEMNIEYLKEERLIQLSNGENKKLQLLQARMEDPGVLILDQPFIGLDKDTRTYLKQQLIQLQGQGVLIIIITTAHEIPDCITHVLTLESGKVVSFTDTSSFKKSHAKDDHGINYDLLKDRIKLLINDHAVNSVVPVIEMSNVFVQYSAKRILEAIDWTIMPGERWLLSGPNGAGKSTLLSLITADNPKAYANTISLFGKRRGTGESIWDIKKRIGFVSPELHVYFNQSSTVFETVASGLFDTIGLFRQISDEDAELINNWMEVTGISSLSQKRLFELSTGEQRSVLLTRAMVKNPELLILDEPCQGLDDQVKDQFLALIDVVCIAGNKTMVFVTHYESDLPTCISHHIKLEQGRIVEKKSYQ